MTRRLLSFRCWLGLCIVLGLAACARTPAPPPTPVTLRVRATDLTAPLVFDLTAVYAEVNPSIFLEVSLVPLSTLNSDLAAGRADLGFVSTYSPNQFATPVGYTPFAVIVHPSNVLTHLSSARLPDIFAGRASRWAQAGELAPQGATIQVVSREPNSDAAEAFALRVQALGGQGSAANSALLAPTWAAMREAVSQDPNAIGYLPKIELDQTVKALE
ncbi:MAG: substrate-binding domain-containing protein, partial [Anaerolineales bacterium]